MVNVYIKERINDQKTICAGGGGVTSNTTYLGIDVCDTKHVGLRWPTLVSCWSRWFSSIKEQVSIFFAFSQCPAQSYLLLEAFIKVKNDLVTFHEDDNFQL